MSSVGDSAVPPVIGAAVELATNLTCGQAWGQRSRGMCKQGKTNKYLWAGNVAAGMAGFPVSYWSMPAGVWQFQLKRSACGICPSSNAQNLSSIPIQSQGLAFLKGKARHSLQQISHGGFVLQLANSKGLFSRTALFSCLSKTCQMEKLNIAFILFACM